MARCLVGKRPAGRKAGSAGGYGGAEHAGNLTGNNYRLGKVEDSPATGSRRNERPAVRSRNEVSLSLAQKKMPTVATVVHAAQRGAAVSQSQSIIPAIEISD